MGALLACLLFAAGALIPAGRQAPRLEAVTFEGTTFSEQISGRVTIVEFFTTWCPHCRRSMVGYQRLKEARDVRLIMVNVEEDPTLVAAFFGEHPAPSGAGILLDPSGSARRTWHVTGFPTTYLLDQNGVIRDAFSGWDNEDAKDLAEKIDALERPPAPTRAQPGNAPARSAEAKAPGPRRRGKKNAPARPTTHDERALQMGVEVIR